MARKLSMGCIGLLLAAGCYNPGDEQKTLSAFLNAGDSNENENQNENENEGQTYGACCIMEVGCESCVGGGGQCIENMTGAQCESAGGSFYENAACDETPCFEEEEEGDGCCLPDGNCFEIPLEVCNREGGTPTGASCANSQCDEEEEEDTGACCLSEGEEEAGRSCAELTREACTEASGDYAGDGTSCESADCEDEEEGGDGCCLPNGNCMEFPRETCLREGGVPSNSSCENTVCQIEEEYGACCVEFEECQGKECEPAVNGGSSDCYESVTASECKQYNGTFYLGESCEEAECGEPQEGGNGCCLPGFGCMELTLEACQREGGTPSGASCENTICEIEVENGACCVEDEECQGKECEPSTSGLGSSCIEDTTAAGCAEAGGTFYVGDSCEEVECDEMEEEGNGCCLPNGACMELSREACMREGGSPTGESCANSQCEGEQEGEGACCQEQLEGAGTTGCTETTRSSCVSAGGDYAGDGTNCESAKCEEEEEEGGNGCCLPDGNCFEVSVETCNREGGTPTGTSCANSQCEEDEKGGEKGFGIRR